MEQTIVVTPSATTAYTVTVMDASGCSDTDEVVVFVDDISADAGIDQSICGDESVTLTASGGVSYQWSNGETSQSITVSPDETTNYTVTVVGINGCSDTDEVMVTVGDGNELASAGFDQTICMGDETMLTASGGESYLWSTGETTASIVVSPDATATYSVIVTNAAGCAGEDAVTVKVSDLFCC